MKIPLVLFSVMTVFFVVLLTANVQAQNKPRSRVSAPPVTTQTATTADGRKVILRSNKTWEYDTDTNPSSPGTTTSARTSVRANSVVSIETGLVFKSGDVKPLARTTFHLLDESLPTILRNAGLKPARDYGEGESDRDYVSSFAFASKYPDQSPYTEFYPKALEALKPHVVQTVTTDFAGKAKFSPVAAGTYYILGVGSTPKGFVIWNLKIDAKSGEVPIILDQNNAEIAL